MIVEREIERSARMARRAERDIYDKILVGAILMLAAEVLGPIPLIGRVVSLLGLVL